MVPTVNTSPIVVTAVDEVASGEESELRVGEVSIAIVVVVAAVKARLGPDAAPDPDRLQLGVCESFFPGVADLNVSYVFALDSH